MIYCTDLICLNNKFRNLQNGTWWLEFHSSNTLNDQLWAQYWIVRSSSKRITQLLKSSWWRVGCLPSHLIAETIMLNVEIKCDQIFFFWNKLQFLWTWYTFSKHYGSVRIEDVNRVFFFFFFIITVSLFTISFNWQISMIWFSMRYPYVGNQRSKLRLLTHGVTILYCSNISIRFLMNSMSFNEPDSNLIRIHHMSARNHLQCFEIVIKRNVRLQTK